MAAETKSAEVPVTVREDAERAYFEAPGNPTRQIVSHAFEAALAVAYRAGIAGAVATVRKAASTNAFVTYAMEAAERESVYADLDPDYLEPMIIAALEDFAERLTTSPSSSADERTTDA